MKEQQHHIKDEEFHLYLREVIERKRREKKLGRSISLIVENFFSYGNLMHFWMIVCVLTIAFLARSNDSFYLTSVLSERLGQELLRSVRTTADFWNYLDSLVDRYSFPKKRWIAEMVQGKKSVKRPSDEWSWVANENAVCGIIRMRQLRVRRSICLDQTECFPTYVRSNSFEDTESFFLTAYDIVRYSRFTHSTPMYGQGGATYGVGGYVVNLNTSRIFNRHLIQKLKLTPWIDRGTRAVIIELTIYNANVNLFCSISVLFEFQAQGGTVACAKIKPVKIITYHNIKDYFLLGFELIYLLIVVYNFMAVFVAALNSSFSYVFMKESTKIAWNVFDVMIVIPTFYVISLKFRLLYARFTKIPNLETWNYGHFPLQKEADVYVRYMDTMGILIFLNLMKTFKYFGLSVILDELTRAITGSIFHALSFLFMFCTVFIAFAFWGFLLFGTKLQNYRSVTLSAYSLFEIVLGECDYSQFMRAHGLWGPIFFIQYVCFVFFVLINVFVALVNEAYVIARDESELAHSPEHLNWKSNDD
ncbi:hypothetical protein ACOME3_001298 [Neoechinorhynchus agilis]